MAFVDVYFSLGSNVGDRLGNIKSALAMMDESLGVHFSRLSSVIETEPWGFESDLFLNCAVLYRIETDSRTAEDFCQEILSKCKAIERNLGREEVIEYDSEGKRKYHSRTIDIDILFYGKENIKTENLIVPHPLIKERDFVMKPLREIAKESLKRTYREIFQINS